MSSKASFILDNKVLFPDFHPGTFQMLEFVNRYQEYQRIGPFESAGIYFRDNCFNYADLKAAATFWDPRQHRDWYAGLYQFRLASSAQHSHDCETVEFATSINERVQAFVEMCGTDEDLPLHESKRIYMRVNPDGIFGETSTALYYNQFRIGYLRGREAALLHTRTSKKHIEAGFGIVASIGKWGPNIDVMATTKKVLEKQPNLKDEQPRIIYYEDYGRSDSKMPTPPQHLFN